MQQQPFLAFAHVRQRLGKWVAQQETVLLELFLDPGEERKRLP
jgi:hypothetical protein